MWLYFTIIHSTEQKKSKELLPELSENVSIRITMKKTRANPQNVIKIHCITLADVRCPVQRNTLKIVCFEKCE
jgi:hypothetical protein